VIYGAEARTLTNKMEKMLMTWERKRIKINSELESKYKSQDTVSVIKV
jgi:hypothetical protein